MIYLAWFVALFGIGLTSNLVAEQRCREIVEAASAFEATRGEWPASLVDLSRYAGKVDGKGRLTLIMSTIFVDRGQISYKAFPDSWVSMALDGTSKQRMEAW